MKLDKKIIALCWGLMLPATAGAMVNSASLNNASLTLQSAMQALQNLTGGSVEQGQYTYQNNTTIPVIMAITDNHGILTRKNVAPGATAAYSFDEQAQISLEVHANLSPLFANYDAAASYEVTVVSGTSKMQLAQSQATDKSLVNSTGWPMQIYCTLENNSIVNDTVAVGQKYNPDTATQAVMLVPIIDNATAQTVAKSGSIENANGALSIKL